MPSLIFNLLSPVIDLLPEKARIQFLCIYKHKSLARLKDPVSFNDKINYRNLLMTQCPYKYFLSKPNYR
jgi:hypothetical protein